MNILDRYILRHFIVNFIILFSVLFLFSCIVDIFVNINSFIESSREHMEKTSADTSRWEEIVELLTLIFTFYFPRLFQFFTYFVGLVTIGAMGFTLVQLDRHRELTAVLAAGISLHRVALPIIIASIVLNVLQFVNRETILPHYAPVLLRSHRASAGDSLKAFRVPALKDAHNRMFYARRFYPDDEKMIKMVVLVFDDELRLTNRIEADEAIWSPYLDQDGNPLTIGSISAANSDVAEAAAGPVIGEWRLQNGTDTPINQASKSILSLATPIMSIPTDIDPTRLLLFRHREFRQMLSLRQVSELQASYSMDQKQLDELQRIRYGRFAQILINVITLMIALPFFLLRSPGNLLVQTMKASALGIFAQFAGALGTVVGLPGIPPATMVFLVPLAILLPLAVALMSRIKT